MSELTAVQTHTHTCAHADAGWRGPGEGALEGAPADLTYLNNSASVSLGEDAGTPVLVSSWNTPRAGVLTGFAGAESLPDGGGGGQGGHLPQSQPRGFSPKAVWSLGIDRFLAPSKVCFLNGPGTPGHGIWEHLLQGFYPVQSALAT